MHKMHFSLICILLFYFIQATWQSGLLSTKLLINYGGITLTHNGRLHEITTKECPGGIFLTKPVNETCLCYNGIFAVVRDCCSSKSGVITTETLEWRKNYQCGMSPEIGDAPDTPIKAILPLTKAVSPFRPVLTFKEFSGDAFQKWRKFDLEMLSIMREPIVFNDAPSVEIVNIRPLKKELQFKIGKYGDIDICYSGWMSDGPQTLRISIYTYEKRLQSKSYCCFRIDKNNSPGIIYSKCRGGSIIAEIVDIESVNSGNICPNRGHSDRSRLLLQADENSINEPKDLIRFKRSETISPPALGDLYGFEDDDQDHSSPRYPLDQLDKDSYDEQHSKMKIFAMMRRKGDPSVIREPLTQRFMLLKKSFQLFTHLVPEEMVPKQMAEDAFEAFYYLYESLDLDTERLSNTEFQRVMGVLGNCSAIHKPWNASDVIEIHYKKASCPLQVDEIVVTDKNGTKDIVRPCPNPPDWLLFNKEKQDIFVEMNWKFIDFVHSICFDEFFDDYNAHHFYENQMEILFLAQQIQDRWLRPVSDSYYANGIITEDHIEKRMKSLDNALGIAHYVSRYKDFLHRPSNVIPESELFNQIKRFEQALAQKLQKLKMKRHDDGDIVDINPTNDENILQSENSPQLRRKKHIGNGYQRNSKHTNKNTQRHSKGLTLDIAKPGDTIWNGLAVCLDAGSNDDPAYYTEQDLWGTKPSLTELGKKYKTGS